MSWKNRENLILCHIWHLSLQHMPLLYVMPLFLLLNFYVALLSFFVFNILRGKKKGAIRSNLLLKSDMDNNFFKCSIFQNKMSRSGNFQNFPKHWENFHLIGPFQIWVENKKIKKKIWSHVKFHIQVYNLCHYYMSCHFFLITKLLCCPFFFCCLPHLW